MTKTNKKTVLLTLAALLLAAISATLLLMIAPKRPAKADGEETGIQATLTYSYSNNAYYVTGYTGTPFNVVIPSTYNDGTNGEHPVTKIENMAFFDCISLTSITIPDSVTSIEYSAFENCTGLTSITIPNSVTSIECTEFMFCTGLTSITIPDSVTSIKSGAFRCCGGLTNVTIPNSVTSIGNYAFEDCSGLTSITIKATTPPVIEVDSFDGTNNCPIYVPEESVNAYKTAPNWDENYASRIRAIPPVLSAEEGAEKLSEPQDDQMLKGKYLLIAADVETVSFLWGNLSKGDGVFAFSWYINGTAGDKNIEYTTIMYNGAEYEYLLFDDNAGYEAFTYQTHNNGNKTIYVSSMELLFDRYGQAAEEPTTEPEQDEPSSEPSTDGKKPFDLGEWFINAGEDVSTWINENVGVATTGSTVLIVGAIIIIIILARKRR